MPPAASAQDRPTELPVPPRAECGPGARPEPGLQGRVPADMPDDGYVCNTQLVSHEGSAGGFKVERFVDEAGRQCAYYDTTLLFPIQAIQQLQDESTGVAVVDMTDPEHPVRTETLVTPAMQTPHESLVLSEKRGLLVAVMGNPSVYPGVVDVYDLNADCRHPELQSSTPVGLLGHESGFAPDGNTFYATSLFTGQITAVDLTNPKVPLPLGVYDYPSHGFAVSSDGNRGYVAALNQGLVVVDTSQIQARQPNPQMPEISRLDWPFRSVPQINIPVTIGGRPYLVEVDEFSADEEGNYQVEGNGPHVGAARIIDISDETRPERGLGHPARGQPAEVPRPGRRRPRRVKPGPGLRRALLRRAEAGRTRASSPARSSCPACACSTSATPTTRGRSRTSSPRRRRARSSRSGPTSRCRSRCSTPLAVTSGTATGIAACTPCD